MSGGKSPVLEHNKSSTCGSVERRSVLALVTTVLEGGRVCNPAHRFLRAHRGGGEKERDCGRGRGSSRVLRSNAGRCLGTDLPRLGRETVPEDCMLRAFRAQLRMFRRLMMTPCSLLFVHLSAESHPSRPS